MNRKISVGTVDDTFEALANAHRRRLLIGLLYESPQDVDTVSGVPWEIAESDENLLTKRHVHLPKLADAGFIEWNREEEVVERGPRFDEIRPFLETVADRRDELFVE